MSIEVGPPLTPTTLAAERQAADILVAVSDQLKEARDAATGWQVGLAGLLTTITALFFIKGKESVDKIGGEWQGIAWQDWITGLLVAAALLACLSSYFLLSAANGNPRNVGLGTIRGEGLYVYNYLRAKHAAEQLRSGQVTLFLMLALVVAAIVITWRAPTATSQPDFQVNRPSTGACGQLTKADNGQFKIVEDANSQEIVPRADLDSLRFVVNCP